MGVVDTLFTKLKCPETSKTIEARIQFKWADPFQQVYNIGDQLESGPYGDIWIKEDYNCDECSVYEKGKFGGRVYKSTVFHDAYMHLDNGKFLEVLTKEEFTSKFSKEEISKLIK